MRRQIFVLLLLPTITNTQNAPDDSDIVDLYSKDSPVVHMDHSNFNQLLYGKQHAWAIEFYNSWCGKCQRYAPTWRRIAQETASWHPVVRVGAINCIRPEHLRICRSHGVSSFPHFRFFRPHTEDGDIGEVKNYTQEMQDMLDLIVNYVTEVQHETPQPAWPDLQEFHGSLYDFLSSPKPLLAVVVEGSVNSTVGRQVALDLSEHRQRVRVARTVLPPFGLQLTETVRPLLVTFRGRLHQFDLVSRDGLPPRKLFTDVLRRALGVTDDRQQTKGPEEKQMGVESPAVETDSAEETAAPGLDAVYMVDLDNAVGYALRQEVAGKKDISGEALSALRNFVEMLIKYLPVRQRTVIDAISELQSFLEDRSSVTGEEVQQHLETARHQLPPHRPWRTCRGSQPRYRGYPCGLWTVLHTVTVTAHRAELGGNVSVLPAIHGYVKHFFSCKSCSQHFQMMSAREALFNVSNTYDAMVWLWRAHNIVNKRLAGDVTEDPEHPKVQFPTQAQCLACFSGENHSEPLVASFLQLFYGEIATTPDEPKPRGTAAKELNRVPVMLFGALVVVWRF